MIKPGIISESFFQDERVKKAQSLILEALREHQTGLEGVKNSHKLLQDDYKNLLKSFAQVRGGKLWYPYIGSGLGNKALVELLDGSIKYDFITGIGVHYLGHSHPIVIKAQLEAALRDVTMQGNLQQNKESYELCKILSDKSGKDHVFLSTSGAMALENSLKIAFQHKSGSTRILAFEKCFMGRTLALSQLTDNHNYRDGIPNTMSVDYIPFFDYKNPEESTNRACNLLKRYLKRYPGEYALMSFELVQGEGGFYTATHHFFEQLMSILKENKVLVLADEVQSFARTPSLFAFHYYGLEKYVDIISIGKISQVCATLYNENLNPRPGLLSQTFTSSTSAIFVAKAILNYFDQEHFFGEEGKIKQYHDYMLLGLQELEKKYSG